MSKVSIRTVFRTLLGIVALCLALLPGLPGPIGYAAAAGESAPVPLLRAGKPVDWWFATKFNAKPFPGRSPLSQAAIRIWHQAAGRELKGYPRSEAMNRALKH